MSSGSGARLEIDDETIEHLMQHGVSVPEVLEVLAGRTVWRSTGTHGPDRRRVLGRTAAGRYLMVICQLKERQVVRPFAAWDMNEHERAFYRRQTGT
jgi:uncharacterized DUF497 family protein